MWARKPQDVLCMWVRRKQSHFILFYAILEEYSRLLRRRVKQRDSNSTHFLTTVKISAACTPDKSDNHQDSLFRDNKMNTNPSDSQENQQDQQGSASGNLTESQRPTIVILRELQLQPRCTLGFSAE